MNKNNKNNEILWNIHRDLIILVLALTLELKGTDYNERIEGIDIQNKIIKLILCLIDGLLYQNSMSIPNGIYYYLYRISDIGLCVQNLKDKQKPLNELYNYDASKWINYFGNNNVFMLDEHIWKTKLDLYYKQNIIKTSFLQNTQRDCVEERPEWIDNDSVWNPTITLKELLQ